MRLDKYLLAKLRHLSRSQVQDLIKREKVSVNGKIVTKPGIEVTISDKIEHNDDLLYVSRAGLKLAEAFKKFGITARDKVALDAGISTGGFTDYLIKNNIKHIYGVDVGHNQLHNSLIDHPKISLLEKTNLKDLNSLPEKIDLVTLDLSFISATHVLEAVKKLLNTKAELVILIKPQFELSPSEITNGVVFKKELHQKAIVRVKAKLEALGFNVVGVIDSPICGSSGNQEFLCYATI